MYQIQELSTSIKFVEFDLNMLNQRIFLKIISNNSTMTCKLSDKSVVHDVCTLS